MKNKGCLDEKLHEDIQDNPLTAAVMFSTVEVVEYLLQAGANANYVVQDYGTPLCRLFHTEGQFLKDRPCELEKKIKILHLLCNYQANVNYNYTEGFGTPLHCLVQTGDGKAVDLLRVLLEKGADLTLKNNDNRTPLREAFDFIAEYADNTELYEENFIEFLQELITGTPLTGEEIEAFKQKTGDIKFSEDRQEFQAKLLEALHTKQESLATHKRKSPPNPGSGYGTLNTFEENYKKQRRSDSDDSDEEDQDRLLSIPRSSPT